MQYFQKEVNDVRLFWRQQGAGQPIILLHPSPVSGAMFGPFINHLSSQYTVYAPDTPGYGDSSAPSERPKYVSDYAQYIARWIKQENIDRPIIYGSATGAQIAIRLGIDSPDLVGKIYLDNTAHFSDEETADILESYFPDLTPREDGSHLEQIWHIAQKQFEYFPWCFEEEKYRIQRPTPPTAVINFVAKAYVNAGANYDWAYRVAFEHERVENIQKLKIPTHIFNWKGSILGAYMERIFDYPLPENVSHSIIVADDPDRYKTMAQYLFEIG